MKKFFSIIAAIIFASTASLSCFAASETLEEVGSKDLSVYVSVVANLNANLFTPTPDEDGVCGFTTPSGVSFSITPEGDSENTPLLSVYEVPTTDTDAKEWLDDCTEKLSDHSLYYDITIEDNDASDGEGADFQIDLPDGYDDASVAFVDADGSVTVIDSEWKNGVLSFQVGESGIYAILYSYGDIDTPVPPTADGIIVSLGASIIAVTALLIVAKKAKKDEKNN